MRLLFAALIVFAVPVPLQAAAQPEPLTCTSGAAEKHLSGAAKTSFMTKCKTDTTTRCNQYALDKKLNGAAKTSFITKCIDDGVG